MEKPANFKPIYNSDRTGRICYASNGRWSWQEKNGDSTKEYDSWRSAYTPCEDYDRAYAKLVASNRNIELQKKQSA